MRNLASLYLARTYHIDRYFKREEDTFDMCALCFIVIFLVSLTSHQNICAR